MKDLNAIGGEDRVERPGESGVSASEQQRDGGGAVGEVHEQVAGGLGGPRPGRARGHIEQVCAAGTVLNRDQGVDPSQHHGIHVHEVHG